MAVDESWGSGVRWQSVVWAAGRAVAAAPPVRPPYGRVTHGRSQCWPANAIECIECVDCKPALLNLETYSYIVQRFLSAASQF